MRAMRSATSCTVEVRHRDRLRHDVMGNAKRVDYRDGRLPLTLTEAPVYVVTDNADAMKANVTRPAGYSA